MAPTALEVELGLPAAAVERRASAASVGSAGSAGSASNWILSARSPLALGTRQDSLPFLATPREQENGGTYETKANQTTVETTINNLEQYCMYCMCCANHWWTRFVLVGLADGPVHFRRSFVRRDVGKRDKKQKQPRARRGMRDVAIEATFHEGNEEDDGSDVAADHLSRSGSLCSAFHLSYRSTNSTVLYCTVLYISAFLQL